MRLLESLLSMTFIICLASSIAGLIWLGASSANPGLALGPGSHALLLNVAIPVTIALCLIFAIVWLFALAPSLQGLFAFQHPAAGSLLACMRDHTTPPQVGLPHARSIWISTDDGVSLGAWHVLPAGPVAIEAARDLAFARGVD